MIGGEDEEEQRDRIRLRVRVWFEVMEYRRE